MKKTYKQGHFVVLKDPSYVLKVHFIIVASLVTMEVGTRTARTMQTKRTMRNTETRKFLGVGVRGPTRSPLPLSVKKTPLIGWR